MNLTNFEKELTSLINRYSLENESNTPDYVLAEYLVMCLRNWNIFTNKRELWFGKKHSITDSIPQPEEPKKVELPEKWRNEQIRDGDIYEPLGDVMLKQNQILDCLRELKEKEGKA